MNEIFVRYSDMPVKIRGLTVLDENGDYNVYINPSYSCEEQMRILNHEITHIKENHFFSNNDLLSKEKEANNG